jgi:hypothetical protein
MPVTPSPFVPSSIDFPALQDTYLGGGWRVVTNTTARDAIPVSRRVEGMRVYSVEDGTEYALSGGVGDGNWVEITRDIPYIGYADPNIGIVGDVVGRIYVQLAAPGGPLVRLWIFAGTPGFTTGWI